jgi:hypothetical protein
LEYQLTQLISFEYQFVWPCFNGIKT